MDGIGGLDAFLVVGVADMLIVFPTAIIGKLYSYPLGFNWYVVTFYVPMVLISQIMIGYWLLSKKTLKL